MPELPEVETTLLGIKPHLLGQEITRIIIRDRRLRWPIPKDICRFEGSNVRSLQRRGKYLLLETDLGTMIIHLGMSGRLRVLTDSQAIQKHDHFDIIFNNGKILRYTDPRRFGAFLSIKPNESHPLLASLGIEPLDTKFTGRYLYQKLSTKKLPIKSAIMDSKILVGVGNIYAAEALYLAQIHPYASAKSLPLENVSALVKAIKLILRQAIQKGGTTLKDFTNSEGKPGYFVQKLQVYGRAGLPCFRCKKPLKSSRLGQRSTVYCEKCQVGYA